MTPFSIKQFTQVRPLSWSAISSFEYDPDQWFSRYILNKRQEETNAMKFGKRFALSCEKRKSLAPVTLYSKVEYALNTVFDGIKMTGFIDTYEPHTALREFKTARTLWTQDKADQHGQIDMYLLQLYITHKVRPEDIKCYLDCIQTEERGDFSIGFVKPIKVHTFETKRSMSDILQFGARIRKVTNEMEEYCNEMKASNLLS